MAPSSGLPVCADVGLAIEDSDGRLDGLWCERYLDASQRIALTSWVTESQQLLDDELRRQQEDEQRQRTATRDKKMRRVFSVFSGVSLILLALAVVQTLNARSALRSAQLAEESARREAKIASDRADAVLSFSRAQTELKAANSQADGLRNDLDGAIDCEDTQCMLKPVCRTTSGPIIVPVPPRPDPIDGSSF